MLSGVPNLAFALGYTNASWTLKCDLVGEYVCRLLNHMDEHGYAVLHAARARPRRATTSRSSTSRPATSCARSTSCPSRARGAPWRLHQNYAARRRAAAPRRARGRGHGVRASAGAGRRRRLSASANRSLDRLEVGPGGQSRELQQHPLRALAVDRRMADHDLKSEAVLQRDDRAGEIDRRPRSSKSPAARPDSNTAS